MKNIRLLTADVFIPFRERLYFVRRNIAIRNDKIIFYRQSSLCFAHYSLSSVVKPGFLTHKLGLDYPTKSVV